MTHPAGESPDTPLPFVEPPDPSAGCEPTDAPPGENIVVQASSLPCENGRLEACTTIEPEPTVPAEVVAADAPTDNSPLVPLLQESDLSALEAAFGVNDAPAEEPAAVPVVAAAEIVAPAEEPESSYYDQAFDEPDGVPSPDSFREFAERGGSPPVAAAPVVPARPVPQPMAFVPEATPTTAPVPRPALGYEFDVRPGFDMAEALAPDDSPVAAGEADAGKDETYAADYAAAYDGEAASDGEDEIAVGSGALGYESAAEYTGTDGGGAWTIPLLCVGLGLIACCLLIPLADANRRAAYERQRLRADLASLQTQVAVNDDFLRRVHSDPTLAERLAQRQMKTVREGSRVLSLATDRKPAADASPFQLIEVPPPPPQPPYRPLGGTMASLCYQPRTRLYVMGVGLFCLAGGLVLGVTPRREM